MDGVQYSAARLAWLYVYGEWPQFPLYHINGGRLNDSIFNLKEAKPKSATKGELPRPSPFITAQRLRQLVAYDPETGLFYWKARPGREAGKTQAGGLVGSFMDQGYRKATIDRRGYRLHRLAWLYMTGEWPQDLIDHKNGIRDDNRWLNLREATHANNMRNSSGHKNRNSPYKGVYKRPNGRWGASIQLGVFDTAEEAHETYMRAARLFFGEFARGS